MHARLPTNHPEDPLNQRQKTRKHGTRSPFLRPRALPNKNRLPPAPPQRQPEAATMEVTTYKEKAPLPRKPRKVPPKKAKGPCPLATANGNRSQHLRKCPTPTFPRLATDKKVPTNPEKDPPPTPTPSPPDKPLGGLAARGRNIGRTTTNNWTRLRQFSRSDHELGTEPQVVGRRGFESTLCHFTPAT